MINYDNRCEGKQFTKEEYIALTSVTSQLSLSRNNERWYDRGKEQVL